jgi:hypothetical protein
MMDLEQDDSIGDQDDFVIDSELEFVNDPLYKDQWGLKGYGINLPEAQKFLERLILVILNCASCSIKVSSTRSLVSTN